MTLTPADLAHLSELRAAATPGPWVRDGYNMSTILHCVRERGHPEARHVCGDYITVVDCCGVNWDANADFIVALVNSAEPLLSAAAERDALRAENARLREALTAVDGIAWSVPFIESTESEALNKRLFDIRALTKAALAPEPTP